MAPSDRDADNLNFNGSEFTAADSGHTATPEEVVATALSFFAEQGFSETKLEKIAKASGMSKRMIHYHFGDKKGLYIKTVSHALQLLRPEAEAMQLDSAVPVDGVRKIVEAVYTQITQHPEAARLLLMENLHSQDSNDSAVAYADESNVLLNLDKLLMLGQDAGAFRPGISAEDVLVLISSLAYFRVSNKFTMKNLYALDLGSEANIEGMKRIVVDTVLAFLTSNIQNSGNSSYLAVGAKATEPETDDSVYNFDTDVFTD
ncbi:TetR family transcriptional regulator [Corynebacterium crudilactis]|uniref:TetR family transcriptional regulator n=1 Tax=Corynebacterium crudilactis TaxID=1652495 RepID=A0A172QVC1_9CORY|nr:TetR family transcriptional regulator [Corynebacterium crudilactis]ANE04606.1 TetR family transcriptional regulator [Corynebacterium crudilactis]